MTPRLARIRNFLAACSNQARTQCPDTAYQSFRRQSIDIHPDKWFDDLGSNPKNNKQKRKGDLND
jgi:hypothetical protein